MGTRRCFTPSILEMISKILGDTEKGLTGSEIQHLLTQSNIEDTDPRMTKWKRLYNAFANYQNKNKRSDAIFLFIKLALSPAKYVDDLDAFNDIRTDIDKQLCFIGYQYHDNGEFSEVDPASTLFLRLRKELLA